MKVLIMYNIDPEKKLFFKKILDKSAELIYYTEQEDEEKKQVLRDAEIIVGGRLRDEQLSEIKNLKMHQMGGTGLNRHNLEFYKKNKILLCNNHSHSRTIAEHGFALLNAVSKELFRNDSLLRKGDWNYRKYESVTLFDKTMLLLGFGEIAKHFMKMCFPFNMKFLAVKRTKQNEDTSVKVFLSEERLKAIKQADFIFNSLPGTEKTRDFLGKKEFSSMKSSAIVINVGRGFTINEKAFYDALKQNKIKAAASDVWYNYPKNRRPGEQDPFPCFPSEYPFHELNNIILSAHRAWNTDIPRERNEKAILTNVNRFIQNEKPLNIVNLEEGY